MRPLSICVGIGLGMGIATGCTIDTGDDPPLPPPWGVPISGGTMLVSRDGNTAVVADPDRDRVVTIDLVAERMRDVFELAPHSEPGRVVEDGDGRFHVALRGSGELLTITGGERTLRSVCGEPRGVAWSETDNLVLVACATGELVSLSPGGGDPVRVVRVERDLRDVLVRADGTLAVTTFRGAELLLLDGNGAITTRIKPPVTDRIDFGDGFGTTVPAIPEVAWRTIVLPNGDIMMSHQRRLGTMLRVVTGGYGGHCLGGAVEPALTIIHPDNVVFAVAPVASASLPVDVAVSPITDDVAIAAAGQDSVFVMPHSSTTSP
ncbi:MAG TPA: hypothetical protein VIV40_06980, partial [Kofleriaceae bacterium]